MRFGRVVAVGAVAALVATACSSSSPGSGSSGSGPIKIGYITSATGIAAPNFADGAPGARAAIDAANAAGGVDGRQLELVAEDDQSNPSLDKTEAQDLVSKGVFGVIMFSPFAFEAAPYLHQKGLPVTGEEFDGPEWGEQPYTNMFSFTAPGDSPIGGKYYTSLDGANWLKSIGVKRLSSLTYHVPSSMQAVLDLSGPAKTIGVADCYDNLNVPYGGTDFTADILQIKSNHCDAVQSPVQTQSVVAIAEGLKQAGLNLTQIYYTGYSQDVLDNPAALAAMNGAYFEAAVNFTDQNAGTQTMMANIAKYDPGYKAGAIPDIGLYGSYIAAQTMIDGLKLAGSVSRTAFIAAMHQQTDYNAGGVQLDGVNYAAFATPDMFGTNGCVWIIQLQGDHFVTANGGKPACGPRVEAPAPPS